MNFIEIITTGGTIEKLYDEDHGTLVNRQSIVSRMLSELRLENLTWNITELMSKDSLEIDDRDRQKIVEAVRVLLAQKRSQRLDGIVILHGTDTLPLTGELLFETFPDTNVPIVLTGAMRPFELRKSDALQNLTEAIFAARIYKSGVHCVAHGLSLSFPGVAKDRKRGTFAKQ